jgi:hypothetical protein
MRLLGDARCEGNGLLRPAEPAGHQGEGLLIRGSAHCRCALPGDSLSQLRPVLNLFQHQLYEGQERAMTARVREK